MRNVRWMVLAVFAGQSLVSAQSTSIEARERVLAARIAALQNLLEYPDNEPANVDRYYAEMEGLTDQVRENVDAYMLTAIPSIASSQQVAERLDRLVAKKRGREDGDVPFARVADLKGGRSLVAAYTIVRGVHHDAATLRGYRATDGGFGLVAVEGTEFDGFTMSVKELPAAVPGELWVLAWGRSHTGNGTIVRMRLYAFDGQKFRTLWSPDLMFGAEVRFSDSGFSVDHYRRPDVVHDEYRLTPAGVAKASSKVGTEIVR